MLRMGRAVVRLSGSISLGVLVGAVLSLVSGIGLSCDLGAGVVFSSNVLGVVVLEGEPVDGDVEEPDGGGLAYGIVEPGVAGAHVVQGGGVLTDPPLL